MIPKIIHYCWFGGKPLPQKARDCIRSWHKYMPEYEIKEWNENNFDVHINRYCSEAYKAKKYAFVSDYARLWIIYRYGGVYFDTDVEVIKPLDNIISNGAYMGCETSPSARNEHLITVNPGLGMAAEAGHPIYKELLDEYDRRSFIRENGSIDTKTIVTTTTELLIKHGLKTVATVQETEGITIYPAEYFCPIDTDGAKHITENTYTIHHYAQSWQSPAHVWLRKAILAVGGSRLKRSVSKLYRKKSIKR